MFTVLLLLLGNIWLILARDSTFYPITSLNTSLPGWTIAPGNTSERICSGEGYISSKTKGSSYWYQFRGTNATAYVLQAHDAAMLEVWLGDKFQLNLNPYNAGVANANSCVLYEYNTPILPYAQYKITIYHDGNTPQVPTGDSYMRINKFVATAPDDLTGSSSSSGIVSSSFSSSLTSSTTSSATSSSGTPTGVALSSSPPVGAIVGGVVGGLLGLVLLLVLLWAAFWRKRPPPDHPTSDVYGQGNMAYADPNHPAHPANHGSPISQGALPSLGFRGSMHNGGGGVEPGKETGQFSPYASSPVHEDHAATFDPYRQSVAVTAPMAVNISPTSEGQTAPWYPSHQQNSSLISPPTSEGPQGPLIPSSHSRTSSAFSLPINVQNRLSSQQLQTIQRMTEQNIPGETLTAVINSMLAEGAVPGTPGHRQAPPLYQPTL